MNVVVFASRKGGVGKSTLAANVANHCHSLYKPCLLIDADPQRSLTLWHRLRSGEKAPLRSGLDDFNATLEQARRDKFEWVFVDTPSGLSGRITAAVAAATLVVIPSRPAIFDLTAVAQTIDVARASQRPFAVVLNGVRPRYLGAESSMATYARQTFGAVGAPVWAGQITQRHDAAGEGTSLEQVCIEAVLSSDEVSGLWSAIESAVKAVNTAYAAVPLSRPAKAA